MMLLNCGYQTAVSPTWSLGSVRQKQNKCCAEFSWKRPTCRLAAFREQVIQLLQFIQSEWREEIHSHTQFFTVEVCLSSGCYLKGQKGERLHINSLQTPVSHRFLSLTLWWTRDNQGERHALFVSFKTVSNTLFLTAYLHGVNESWARAWLCS